MRRTRRTVIVLHFILYLSFANGHSEKTLRQHLFANYSSFTRPLKNESEPIYINFSMKLIRLYTVEERTEKLASQAYYAVSWQNQFLRYNSGCILYNFCSWTFDQVNFLVVYTIAYRSCVELHFKRDKSFLILAIFGKIFLQKFLRFWKKALSNFLNFILGGLLSYKPVAYEKNVYSTSRWNPADYGGVRSIEVDPKRVWIPDIILKNNADRNPVTIQKGTDRVWINHRGVSSWYPKVMMISSFKAGRLGLQNRVPLYRFCLFISPYKILNLVK